MNKKHKQKRGKKERCIRESGSQLQKKPDLSLPLQTCSLWGVVGEAKSQEETSHCLFVWCLWKGYWPSIWGHRRKGSVQLNVLWITLVSPPMCIDPLPLPWRQPSSAYNKKAGIVPVLFPSNLNKASIFFSFSGYHLTRFIVHAYMPQVAY